MNEKILIVTLQDDNYGNRLQNYALQALLTNNYYEVYNIRYSKLAIMIIARNLVNTIKGNNKQNDIMLQKRSITFKSFNENYIFNVLDIGFFKTGKLKIRDFKYILTGSDQVWHKWSRFKKWLDFFYLTFAPKEKRVAYAPSFGFIKFNKKDIEFHKNGLLGFEKKKISIREKHGSDLIKELVGYNVPVVPDPTLLLFQSDWNKIAKRPEYEVPEHFVLQYFLGDSHHYDKKLPVIDIYNSEKEEWFMKTGPSEFIWLIQHCDYVCTDSFHACVFSIIFHKDFAVFHRKQNGMEGMFDRIDTLLDNTGLEQCIDNFDNHDINWNKVDAEIEKRRKVGIDFLRNALGDDNIK